MIKPKYKEADEFVNGWAAVSKGKYRDRYFIDAVKIGEAQLPAN